MLKQETFRTEAMKYISNISILAFLVCCNMMPISVLAQDEITAKTFDEDGDEIINEEEQIKLVLHLANPSFKTLDRNGDGEVSRTEVKEAINDPLNNVLWSRNSDINQLRGEGQLRLEIVDAKYFPPPADKPDTDGIAGFRLRRDLDDSTLIDTLNNEDSFAEADAASVSFLQDFENDTSTISARAAIFRPFRKSTGKAVTTQEDGPVLTRYQITPGVAIDVVEEVGSDDGDEAILTFGLNTDFEVQSVSIFPNQYFRGNLLYETDLGLDSSTIAGEFQWEPVNNSIGLAGARVKKLFGLPIDLKWRGIVNAEIGSVLNSADLQNVNDGDFFFRIGPKLEIEFFPNTDSDFLNRFGLQAEYSRLQKIAGDLETTDLFETILTYRIDNKGNTNFEASYRVGEIALTGQDVEELFFGLSFKF